MKTQLRTVIMGKGGGYKEELLGFVGGLDWGN